MRKIGSFILLLSLMSVLITGCEGTTESLQGSIVEITTSAVKETSGGVPESTKETETASQVAGGTQEKDILSGGDMIAGLSIDQSVEINHSKLLAAYAKALESIFKDGKWPQEMGSLESHMELINNKNDVSYAIEDVDGDGIEELVVSSMAGSMADMVLHIFQYNLKDDSYSIELTEFPSIAVYDNGILLADWSHNQGMGNGDLWPYTVYQYDPMIDEYMLIGSVDTWSKEYFPESYSGEKFPDSLDKDKDGNLYVVGDMNLKTTYMDKADYENYLKDLLKDAKDGTKEAKLLELKYQPIDLKETESLKKNYEDVLSKYKLN